MPPVPSFWLDPLLMLWGWMEWYAGVMLLLVVLAAVFDLWRGPPEE